MTYFTTMNLPAPPYDLFVEKLSIYKKRPIEAVQDFECGLRDFFKVEAVSTFSNCFTALALALLNATRNRPKTVVVAGLAYRRTTDIVLWSGLSPLYVDNDPQTLGMSLKSLEERIKFADVGCVLVQHPMVNICNPESYISLCNHYGVPVVMDSVEATGSAYGNKRVGGFGTVEGFSLHPSKVLNGAEGGVLTFGQIADYHEFREYMRIIGVANEEGDGNRLFALEPVHAMLGLASLDIYPDMRATWKTQYLEYRENLRESNVYRLIEYDMTTDPNYKSVLIELQTPTPGFRDALIEHLESQNIGARPYYSPLHPNVKRQMLPEAAALSERYFLLPIGHSVSLDDIEFICRNLLSFGRQKRGSQHGIQGDI